MVWIIPGEKKTLTFSVNSTRWIQTQTPYMALIFNTNTLYGPLSVYIDRLWLRVQNYCLPDFSWPSWYLFCLRLTPVVKIEVTCNQPYQASLNCHYWYPQDGLPPQSVPPEVARSCSSQEWWTYPQGSFIQTIDNRSQESQAPYPAVHGRLQMRPQSMRNWSKQLGRSCNN